MGLCTLENTHMQNLDISYFVVVYILRHSYSIHNSSQKPKRISPSCSCTSFSIKNMSICWPKASVTFCSSSLIFSGLWNGMILVNREYQQGQRSQKEASVVSSCNICEHRLLRLRNSALLICSQQYDTVEQKRGVERKQNAVIDVMVTVFSYF